MFVTTAFVTSRPWLILNKIQAIYMHNLWQEINIFSLFSHAAMWRFMHMTSHINISFVTRNSYRWAQSFERTWEELHRWIVWNIFCSDFLLLHHVLFPLKLYSQTGHLKKVLFLLSNCLWQVLVQDIGTQCLHKFIYFFHTSEMVPLFKLTQPKYAECWISLI